MHKKCVQNTYFSLTGSLTKKIRIRQPETFVLSAWSEFMPVQCNFFATAIIMLPELTTHGNVHICVS